MVALHVSRPKICNICTNFTKPVPAIRLSSLKGAKTRCLAYHVGNQILHNIRKSYTQIWQIQVILGRFRRGLILIKFVGPKLPHKQAAPPTLLLSVSIHRWRKKPIWQAAPEPGLWKGRRRRRSRLAPSSSHSLSLRFPSLTCRTARALSLEL